MIELQRVTKQYGDLTALRDVTLTVREGEVFGLLGRNGAGKTTALRLITGLTRPTAGAVRVWDHDPWTASQAVRRALGVMLDSGGLYDNLSVEENLRLAAALYGAPRQAARAALERMEALELAPRLAGKLSKGQRQRVALARAILHSPRLLVLDEPTAGLDPVAAAGLHDTIRELRRGGATILLCSHDMAEVEALCDRVCLLEQGQVRACDTPDGLKALAGAGTTLADVFIQLTGRPLTCER